MENFDLAKIKNLSHNEGKTYIDKYFIPLTNGEHAFLINGQYEISDEAIIKKTYFKRMSNDLTKYYFTEKIDLRTITFDVNKPTLYDNYLNLCPKIKQTIQPYNTFSKEIKDKVDFILNHIFEVYCSSNKESYEFVLKWFSNAVRGNRNDSALYLKGPQGAGKSSIVDDFMRFCVIGQDLSHQGGSGPLKNHFNSELSGKLWVLFEELETMSKSEWMGVSCKLKRQITSKTLSIERKGKEVREEKNLNNYILLSNNDAIQDDEGRRYFILDINCKYINNKEYFTKLHSYFNDEVGKAFYNYLLEIDLTNYNAQHYPMTKSKLDSFVKRLDNIFKFIKEEYILKHLGLKKVSLKDLYIEYENWCATKSIKAKPKQDFNNTLESVNIKNYKSNKANIYNYSLSELEEIANKYHWIHEFDLEEDDEVKPENPLDNGIQQEPDYKKLYFELLAKQQPKEELKTEEVKKEEVIELKEEEIVNEIIDEDIDDIVNFVVSKTKQRKNKK